MSAGGYGQQPYGQQPQYGQPGYGPPPGYGGPPGYGAPAGYGGPGGYGPPRARFGLVGTALAAVGAVLLIVAFTATHWYDGSQDSSFSKVKDQLDVVDKAGAAEGIAKAYFGWLAWVLLALAVLVAIAANLPSPAAGVLRAVGAVVGIAGIVVTFLAIKLVDTSKIPGAGSVSGVPDSYSDYLKHTGVAFYLALGGFLLAAVGSIIGPRKA